MAQSSLSESLSDMPSTPYYCGFKTSDIGQYFYKIHDDSVRLREFLGADNEDEIEAILSDREGHSLHEFIDGDEPLWPIIDFDLPVETLNAITPKLSFSSDEKKISLHDLTSGMRLPNIAQVAMFTELVHKKLPEGL
ncbi:hypothetical protein C1646_769932 [Rhizophagus diaphanus]|nr:hypothetical protein C1646_769932 [Rhizophagus diaphanus] [Rhizophagus sp. MUCL 43196]